MKELIKKTLQENFVIKNTKKRKHILKEGVINESMAVGKHLVVVDFQPEYQSGFGTMAEDLADFINENFDNLTNVTFLYNGSDTMGMIGEDEYMLWWHEQGLDEEIIARSDFYDKGYAFFRYCMDMGADDEQTVNLIKFMIANNINDSRDMDFDFWKAFVDEYDNDDIRELMEGADDCINIPDLMDELRGINNIVLVGGGINECLREVVIALDALDKSYDVWSQYTY